MHAFIQRTCKHVTSNRRACTQTTCMHPTRTWRQPTSTSISMPGWWMRLRFTSASPPAPIPENSDDAEAGWYMERGLHRCALNCDLSVMLPSWPLVRKNFIFLFVVHAASWTMCTLLFASVTSATLFCCYRWVVQVHLKCNVTEASQAEKSDDKPTPSATLPPTP